MVLPLARFWHLACGTMDLVTQPTWVKILLAASVAFLTLATLVWSSGEDMFFGSMLLVVAAGWGLVGLYGIVSFVRAAQSRTRHWLRSVAVTWIGCVAAFLGSVGIGLAGVPEDVRIWLSRDALIDAGRQVLAGEHPTRAGLYGFGDTSIVDDCAMLETSTFAISSSGFAYCPTHEPTAFEHVGGSLYRYTFD